MGNVCTNNCEKDEGTETVDTSKNSVEMQGNLGEHCTVHLILGNFSFMQVIINKIELRVY